MSVYSLASGIKDFQALPDLSSEYADIDSFLQIFSGDPPWKTAKKSGLYHSGMRSVYMLNTAKTLCDFFSQLIFSEQVSITADNTVCNDFINHTLEQSGFFKRMPEWLAFAFASGGGVLKSYIYKNNVCVDFVNADRFIPLEWDNNTITAGAFFSVTYQGGFFYTLVEKHYFNDSEKYVIENRLFKSKLKNSVGNEVPLAERFPFLSPVSVFKAKAPMFSYFRPAVSNNMHQGSVLGLSAFANAVDTLKALDIAFDSFAREFILGKKRIIVPSSCVQTVVDITTGEQRQYFDADDEALSALKLLLVFLLKLIKLNVLFAQGMHSVSRFLLILLSLLLTRLQLQKYSLKKALTILFFRLNAFQERFCSTANIKKIMTSVIL